MCSITPKLLEHIESETHTFHRTLANRRLSAVMAVLAPRNFGITAPLSVGKRSLNTARSVGIRLRLRFHIGYPGWIGDLQEFAPARGDRGLFILLPLRWCFLKRTSLSIEFGIALVLLDVPDFHQCHLWRTLVIDQQPENSFARYLQLHPYFRRHRLVSGASRGYKTSA